MQFLSGQAEKDAVAWMQKAALVAKKALCHRAKCGAIIVNERKIIGRGYNAPPLDKEANRRCHNEFVPGKPKYDKTCCMHAEWRAIMDALRSHPDMLPGSILYFTRVDDGGQIVKSGKPFCTVCSRLALDSGIDKFVLWHEQGIAEYTTEEFNNLSYEYPFSS